mgnify:CR=1 FL=1
MDFFFQYLNVFPILVVKHWYEANTGTCLNEVYILLQLELNVLLTCADLEWWLVFRTALGNLLKQDIRVTRILLGNPLCRNKISINVECPSDKRDNFCRK